MRAASALAQEGWLLRALHQRVKQLFVLLGDLVYELLRQFLTLEVCLPSRFRPHRSHLQGLELLQRRCEHGVAEELEYVLVLEEVLDDLSLFMRGHVLPVAKVGRDTDFSIREHLRGSDRRHRVAVLLQEGMLRAWADQRYRIIVLKRVVVLGLRLGHISAESAPGDLCNVLVLKQVGR